MNVKLYHKFCRIEYSHYQRTGYAYPIAIASGTNVYASILIPGFGVGIAIIRGSGLLLIAMNCLVALVLGNP